MLSCLMLASSRKSATISIGKDPMCWCYVCLLVVARVQQFSNVRSLCGAVLMSASSYKDPTVPIGKEAMR